MQGGFPYEMPGTQGAVDQFGGGGGLPAGTQVPLPPSQELWQNPEADSQPPKANPTAMLNADEYLFRLLMCIMLPASQKIAQTSNRLRLRVDNTVSDGLTEG
jgi:hypothetical protein